MSVIRFFSTQRIDKSCDYIENEYFTPVRCGAVFDKSGSTLPGDDTGENISHKRMTHCELTTQYWAWKNVEADYYGFGHYRRYFAFQYKKEQLDDWGCATTAYLDEDSMEFFGFCPDDLSEIVESYDVITPVPVDLKRVNLASVRDQYKTGARMHVEDLDLALEIIDELFPAYSEAAQTYINGQTMYMCNMFVLRRDLFMNYSAWLFAILDEFERRADMSDYSVEGRRTPGHLGERLFGVYLTWLKMQGELRVGEFPICNIANPERMPEIAKAFDGESVNVVFSSSEYFAPYCAAAARSVIRNADPHRNYDILVLEQEMSEKNKKRLKSLADGKENICLRTVNVRRWFSKYALRVREHFSVETYFRLVIPELLADYDKVLYLDCDLIAMTDVAALFDTDVSDCAVAAAWDVVHAGILNGFNKEKVPYYRNHVRVKNYLEQLNGGVMLLNNRKIREQYTAQELLAYAERGNFELADQDVFNSLFQDQIKWVDQAWNAANDEQGSLRAYVAAFAPEVQYEAYQKAIKHPKIIHYAGTVKPWHDPGGELAEEFWSVLRETPFYDLGMYRRVVENAQFYASNAVANLPAAAPRRAPKQPKQGSLLRRMADRLMPKGTRRRESVKKVIFKLIGKEYVTPYYMLVKGN